MAIVISKVDEVFTITTGSSREIRFSKGGFFMKNTQELQIHNGNGRTMFTDTGVNPVDYDIATENPSDVPDLCAKLHALGLNS